jgi:hypothetical protein
VLVMRVDFFFGSVLRGLARLIGAWDCVGNSRIV